MTTTVLIGTMGNKNVRVKSPQGELILKPGHWLTLGIHGEQTLSVQEDGDFVTVEAGWVFEPPAPAPAPVPLGSGGHGEE